MPEHTDGRRLHQADERNSQSCILRQRQYVVSNGVEQILAFRLFFGRLRFSGHSGVEHSQSAAGFFHRQNSWIVLLEVRDPHRINDRILDLPAAREDCLHGVVVLLRDRIKFVIMAASTAERQPHKRRAGRIDPIRIRLVTDLLAVHIGFVNLRPQRVKTGACPCFQVSHFLRRDRVIAIQSNVVRPEFVASNLFLHEHIVGLVVIERLHHVIPKTPGVAVVDVGLKASAVRVASHIQPVTPPAFAILRRRQQLVDQTNPCVLRRLPLKRFNLLRSRWQANQIKVRTSNQSSGIGSWRRLQSVRVKLSQNKRIDRRSNPGWLTDGRWIQFPDRLKGPERSWIGDDMLRRHLCGLTRIHRAFSNPLFNRCDVRIAKLYFRHLQIRIGMLHRKQKYRIFRITRHNRRTTIAALHPFRPRVQTKPGFLTIRTMTFDAVSNQQRSDG